MSAGHSIIVIGASAGGVEALTFLLRQLPKDIPASLFITVHFPADAESVLARILDRVAALSVHAAVDGEPIVPGHVYVAPPDRHLLVIPGEIRLARGPMENGKRPAIDPMFRSAAVAYGRRVVGVVLTGNLDDGTAGLLAIKRRGGIAVVQDPADAMFPSMPASAVRHVDLDHVVPLDEMAALLYRLATEPPPVAAVGGQPMDDARRETEYSAFDLEVIEDPSQHPGEPSPFACPDCGGVLWQLRDGDTVRYRCRVGHGWTSEALLAQQENTLESALWAALRALEETASLNDKLAARIAAQGSVRLRERFLAKARAARERAAAVRRLLMEPRPSAEGQSTEAAEEPIPTDEETTREPRRRAGGRGRR